MIARIVDSVSAWLYRRRYEASQRRRRLAEQRAASSTWFVVALLTVDLTAGVVSLPGCAHRADIRTSHQVREECLRQLGDATTEDEIDAVLARCEARFDEVTP